MGDVVAKRENSNGEYRGLTFEKYHTRKGEDVYATPIRKTDVVIPNDDGSENFRQNGVEVPESWSDQAAKVVSSKYFKDRLYGSNEREKSASQLVSRVVDTLTKQGIEQGYFDAEQGEVFRDELAYMMLHQRASFNSPVWFNAGLSQKYDFKGTLDEKFHWAFDPKTGEYTQDIDIYERPQLSACFISGLDDNMGDIFDLSKREGMLFKWGSGNGTNFRLRGYHEPLSHGGKASGVMYFLKGLDIWAGVIKSGGKTRRAAKMVIMDDDHPDIFRFIRWKGEEEKKAKALQIFSKYAPLHPFDLDDEAHATVSGQNSNNSIRFSDRFMEAYQKGEDWTLKYITAMGRDDVKEMEIPKDEYDDDRHFSDREFITGTTNKRKFTKAETLMDLVADTARQCGDPGVQYGDTINKWHTCPNSGEIKGSNPCSEYMFLDDSSCNLASVNLMAYVDEKGVFDIDAFRHDIPFLITAQEIIVDFASYPGPHNDVAENSHRFRPLGLGYCDLGGLLMSNAISYDSDEGRNLASGVTALMTGIAYNASAKIAEVMGAFDGFEKNREPFMKVMNMHRDAAHRIEGKGGLEVMMNAAKEEWDAVVEQDSFRNAQATLIAPTGTIGFMMDVDTTGIEPLLNLASDKGLSGGGKLEIVAKSVEPGLRNLDYSENQIKDIMAYIVEKDGEGMYTHPWIDENAPHVKEEHRGIFSTALGANDLSAEAHLGMMAAVQPFLSGAISKTVNLPRGTTTEQIKDVYTRAHQIGLKSVALYVDGSKGIQPVRVREREEETKLNWGEKKRVPGELNTYKIKVRVGPNIGGINGTPVHFHFGEDPITGMPYEFFVSFGGAGSAYSNAYDSMFKAVSRGAQFGEPLDKIVADHLGANGAIKGFTDHPNIKTCTSIEDLWAKLTAGHYLEDIGTWQVQPNLQKLRKNVLERRRKFEETERLIHPEYYEENGDNGEKNEEEMESEKFGQEDNKDHIPCSNCGGTMVINGANCYKCPGCFNDTGCG
tara:strand:+ start:4884 stop:7880 length:2997 start_codon:yes stop_codon:yes gene_type:complete